MFAENIRDGIACDPIEVEPCPDRPGFYRLLDGAHRWNAYKATGMEAATQMDTDIKIFRMHSLGIPQDRIAKQMGINQASIHNHFI
jgi:hypothetical protein